MLELPDELLRQIASQVLEEGDGLRLWCMLASTCKRFWRFQLPSEPTLFLDNSLNSHGMPWALERLREACKLNLTVSEMVDGRHDALNHAATAMMQASHGLAKLETLALSMSRDANVMRHCRPWVERLLLGATSLTALSTCMGALPCTPIVQRLPLQHLELQITHLTEQPLGEIFADISCCLSLVSLRVISPQVGLMTNSEGLPSVDLRSMPCLKHVRLDDCYPAGAFHLPPDCSLFLDLCSLGHFEWHEHEEKFRDHASVLRLVAGDCREWPSKLHQFSKLQYFELDTQGEISGQDVADLQHIPNVKIIMDGEEELRLTGGSWESLGIYQFGQLDLVISDVDSFVRDTKSFTFMSESSHGASQELFREFQGACRRHGRACHVRKHMGLVHGERARYVTLSSSKEIAENCPVFYDDSDKDHHPIDLGGDTTLVDWDDFWPCNPCALVKRAEEPEPELW